MPTFELSASRTQGNQNSRNCGFIFKQVKPKMCKKYVLKTNVNNKNKKTCTTDKVEYRNVEFIVYNAVAF